MPNESDLQELPLLSLVVPNESVLYVVPSLQRVVPKESLRHVTCAYEIDEMINSDSANNVDSSFIASLLDLIELCCDIFIEHNSLINGNNNSLYYFSIYGL